MSAQMSFVYLTATGNVLSFVTTVAPPTASLTAADLAMPSLAVRDVMDDSSTSVTRPAAVFNIPPDKLSVFTGDVIPDAQLNPRSYRWNPDSKIVEALPAAAKVAVVAKALPMQVKLTLTPAPASPTPALVIYPGADPVKSDIVQTTIPVAGSTTLNLSGLAAGMYVLAVTAGYPLVISKVT